MNSEDNLAYILIVVLVVGMIFYLTQIYNQNLRRAKEKDLDKKLKEWFKDALEPFSEPLSVTFKLDPDPDAKKQKDRVQGINETIRGRVKKIVDQLPNEIGSPVTTIKCDPFASKLCQSRADWDKENNPPNSSYIRCVLRHLWKPCYDNKPWIEIDEMRRKVSPPLMLYLLAYRAYNAPKKYKKDNQLYFPRPIDFFKVTSETVSFEYPPNKVFTVLNNPEALRDSGMPQSEIDVISRILNTKTAPYVFSVYTLTLVLYAQCKQLMRDENDPDPNLAYESIDKYAVYPPTFVN